MPDRFHISTIALIFIVFVHFGASTFDCSSSGGKQLRSKCYKFLNESESLSSEWWDAKMLCRIHFHPWADLPIITDDHEREFVETFAGGVSAEQDFWLGYTPFNKADLVKVNRYRKVRFQKVLLTPDYAYAEYHNWAVGYPRPQQGDRHCVYVDSSVGFKWKHVGCKKQKRAFPMCELKMEFGDPFPFPKEITSALDPPDSTAPLEECTADGSGAGGRTGRGGSTGSTATDKPKIFQIGFDKCGTSSLFFYFRNNGISSLHHGYEVLANTLHKNFQKSINHGRRNNANGRLPSPGEVPLLLGEDYISTFTFYSDISRSPTNYAHVVYFKYLAAQYPTAKFILNTRNVTKWIASRSTHENGNYLAAFQTMWNASVDDVHTLWRKNWEMHLEDVRSFFKNEVRVNAHAGCRGTGTGMRMVEFDIENDGIEKLIEFFKDDYKLEAKHWKHVNPSKK